MPESSDTAGKFVEIIRTPDQRLRVFISSTMQELAEERQSASRAIASLRLTPVLFELGARPHPPRNLYRAYLTQSHIFIGIYWQRYGWVAPEMDISGLEDEYHLAESLPKLIYLKTPAPDREPRLAELLDEIKDDGLSYKYFTGAEELGELIQNDLALLLTEQFEQARMQPPPAGRKSAAARVGLPHYPTALIGRQAEIRDLRLLLARPQARLVTLTGTGGVGKTRLALEVAAGLEDSFEHGVFWIEFAAIRDPDLVTSTIAKALDVREVAGYPLLESIKDYLHDKRLLLLLDNFEQVIPAGLVLSELLASAPGLMLLVTSRAPLRLQGEQEYRVPPLPVPEAGASLDPDSLQDITAVRLFAERAQAVQPGFTLTLDNLPVVAEIVRRLDGLPLAIELAAARVKLLPPRHILDRLDDRLKLLTGGAQDLPKRQQTMRSTIDWSYSLLSRENQDLFARLGVFVGSFSLLAAEQVCQPGGEADVLEGIASLLDNNLLRQDTVIWDQPRYNMLEIIREYALDRLGEVGEDAPIRKRHAGYFSEFATQAEPRLFSGEGEQWLDRLEADYGNLRAALEWYRSSPEFQPLAWPIVIALTWFWYRRGFLNEARQWCEQAVDRTAPLGKDPLRATLLTYSGLIAMWQSDLARAAPLMDEGLKIMREVGSSYALANTLFNRGVLALNGGDAQDAHAIFQEALPLFREVGQEWFQAMILLHLGNISLIQGDVPAARDYLDRCHSLGRRIGDRWILASAINNYGEIARYGGDHDGAEGFYLESREMFREVRSSPDVARETHSLAWVALAHGDAERAGAQFEEALAAHQQLGIQRGAAECLVGLGAVAGARGEAEKAAELLAAGRSRFSILGAGIWPADDADFRRCLAQLRSRLDEHTFSAAWERGQSAAQAGTPPAQLLP